MDEEVSGLSILFTIIFIPVLIIFAFVFNLWTLPFGQWTLLLLLEYLGCVIGVTLLIILVIRGLAR